MTLEQVTSGMLTVEQVDENDAAAMLASAAAASWQQFPAYAAIAAQTSGSESRYLLVSENSRALALCNVRIKRIPYTCMGLALIAQGPVLLADDDRILPRVLHALRQQLVEAEGLTLRINPPVEPGRAVSLDEAAGFVRLPSHRYETFLLDLQPGEPALRARLDGKWRTDLRRGERSGIEITRTSDPADFQLFQLLLAALAKAKGFTSPQNAEFFARVADRARGPEDFTLHLAWYEGQLVGGHLGAYSGHMAVYLLGATSDSGRELRASFVLQWAAIGYARERGIAVYDLGGVDAVGNPQVHRFKKRMGGIHYLGPPMLEARPRWPAGAIIRFAEWLHIRTKG